MITSKATDYAGKEILCSVMGCGKPSGYILMSIDKDVAYCSEHSPQQHYFWPEMTVDQWDQWKLQRDAELKEFESLFWTTIKPEEDNLWGAVENIRFACSGNDCGTPGWHPHAPGTNPKKIIKGRKRAMRKRRKKLESNTIKKGE